MTHGGGHGRRAGGVDVVGVAMPLAVSRV
jgi:hypothetical protein